MNIWKGLSLVAMAASVVIIGYRAAEAQACRNQPNMEGALTALRSARASLERAEHNKGGWRERAIGSTDEALSETQRGCAAADIR